MELIKLEETKVVEQPHSVEISVNAKGLYSGKVKVYAKTIDEAMKSAVTKADELAMLIAGKNGL